MVRRVVVGESARVVRRHHHIAIPARFDRLDRRLFPFPLLSYQPLIYFILPHPLRFLLRFSSPPLLLCTVLDCAEQTL